MKYMLVRHERHSLSVVLLQIFLVKSSSRDVFIFYKAVVMLIGAGEPLVISVTLPNQRR